MVTIGEKLKKYYNILFLAIKIFILLTQIIFILKLSLNIDKSINFLFNSYNNQPLPIYDFKINKNGNYTIFQWDGNKEFCYCKHFNTTIFLGNCNHNFFNCTKKIKLGYSSIKDFKQFKNKKFDLIEYKKKDIYFELNKCNKFFRKCNFYYCVRINKNCPITDINKEFKIKRKNKELPIYSIKALINKGLCLNNILGFRKYKNINKLKLWEKERLQNRELCKIGYYPNLKKIDSINEYELYKENNFNISNYGLYEDISKNNTINLFLYKNILFNENYKNIGIFKDIQEEFNNLYKITNIFILYIIIGSLILCFDITKILLINIEIHNNDKKFKKIESILKFFNLMYIITLIFYTIYQKIFIFKNIKTFLKNENKLFINRKYEKIWRSKLNTVKNHFIIFNYLIFIMSFIFIWMLTFKLKYKKTKINERNKIRKEQDSIQKLNQSISFISLAYKNKL